ncbi:hypothetical protein C2845_PM12G13660 [Panicum miliaceum]|uniref:Uncharacterized protein n=1 Tax=Panicum miliaceum TaxID=4540 RepID=A0A3L6QDP8_PANMI|nr:hypothetical protein C2845_PM12G13660 [Panicum miliaceum]
MEWLKKLNFKETEKWHPWFVENQIAGYSMRYGSNILFATIKGYSLCNPAVDVDIENNAHVPYAFRMGLISDELFQSLVTTCNGKYWNSSSPSCQGNMEQFYMDQEQALQKLFDPKLGREKLHAKQV